MNQAIYKPELRFHSESVFGKYEGYACVGDDCPIVWESPIVQGFLADDDIQQITLVSTCIGFVKTLTKQYRDDLRKKPEIAAAEKARKP